MDRIRQLSLDLVAAAPKPAIAPRTARRVPFDAEQERREQAAAAASAYIERWFAYPRSTKALERAQLALQEALER